MKILSLFDGVSCARLAIERAGIPIEAYYASEIDKYAIKVTQANRPDTIQIGSVKDFGIMESICIDKIDLLIGGSPCQDLSIAKKDRKGLEGNRSSLFYEYVRILNEVKPKYFILENVASMPQKDKDIISQTLGVQPVMINASLVSAQNRKRLFWVGKLDEFRTYKQVEIPQPEDRGIMLRDILEENVDEKYEVNACSYRGRNIVNGKRKDVLGAKTEQRLEIGGLKANTITSVFKDSMVRIGQFNSGGQGDRVYSPEGKSATLSALGGGRGAKTGLYCVGIIPESIKPKGNYLPRERVYSDQGKFRAISTVSNQQPSVLENSIIRKLTPIECERLQCMPDNWTNPTGDVSNSQRYKMCGNAFNVDVVAHIIRQLAP